MPIKTSHDLQSEAAFSMFFALQPLQWKGYAGRFAKLLTLFSVWSSPAAWVHFDHAIVLKALADAVLTNPDDLLPGWKSALKTYLRRQGSNPVSLDQSRPNLLVAFHIVSGFRPLLRPELTTTSLPEHCPYVRDTTESGVDVKIVCHATVSDSVVPGLLRTALGHKVIPASFLDILEELLHLDAAFRTVYSIQRDPTWIRWGPGELGYGGALPIFVFLLLRWVARCTSQEIDAAAHVVKSAMRLLRDVAGQSDQLLLMLHVPLRRRAVAEVGAVLLRTPLMLCCAKSLPVGLATFLCAVLLHQAGSNARRHFTPADVNVRDERGRTAFMLAPSIEVFDQLLLCSSNTLWQTHHDRTGGNIFHAFMSRLPGFSNNLRSRLDVESAFLVGQEEFLTVPQGVGLVKYVLAMLPPTRRQALLTERDNNGCTPYHLTLQCPSAAVQLAPVVKDAGVDLDAAIQVPISWQKPLTFAWVKKVDGHPPSLAAYHRFRKVASLDRPSALAANCPVCGKRPSPTPCCGSEDPTFLKWMIEVEEQASIVRALLTSGSNPNVSLMQPYSKTLREEVREDLDRLQKSGRRWNRYVVSKTFVLRLLTSLYQKM